MASDSFGAAARHEQPQQPNFQPLIAFFDARPDLDNLVIFGKEGSSLVKLTTLPNATLPEGMQPLAYPVDKKNLTVIAGALEATGNDKFKTLITRLRDGDAVYNGGVTTPFVGR